MPISEKEAREQCDRLFGLDLNNPMHKEKYEKIMRSTISEELLFYLLRKLI